MVPLFYADVQDIDMEKLIPGIRWGQFCRRCVMGFMDGTDAECGRKKCEATLMRRMLKELLLPAQIFLESSDDWGGYFDDHTWELLDDLMDVVSYPWDECMEEIRLVYTAQLSPVEEEKYATYCSIRSRCVVPTMWEDRHRQEKPLDEEYFFELRELGSNEELVRLNLAWRNRNRDDLEGYAARLHYEIWVHLDQLESMKHIFEEYRQELQADEDDLEHFEYEDTPQEQRIADDHQTLREKLDTHDRLHGYF